MVMGRMYSRLRKFAEKYGVRATEADVVEFDSLNETARGYYSLTRK